MTDVTQLPTERQRAARTEHEFLVFRVVTMDELAEMAQRLDMEVPRVYVPVSVQATKSRKEAIRAQAKEDDSHQVLYAAVAKEDISEHAPEKRVTFD